MVMFRAREKTPLQHRTIGLELWMDQMNRKTLKLAQQTAESIQQIQVRVPGKGLWQGREDNFCVAVTAVITASIAGEPCVKTQAPAKRSCPHLSIITQNTQGNSQLSVILIPRIGPKVVLGSALLSPQSLSIFCSTPGICPGERQGWHIHRAEQSHLLKNNFLQSSGKNPKASSNQNPPENHNSAAGS